MPDIRYFILGGGGSITHLEMPNPAGDRNIFCTEIINSFPLFYMVLKVGENNDRYPTDYRISGTCYLGEGGKNYSPFNV